MKFKDSDSSGGGSFVRIKDGENVVGIFQGDPVEYRQHFSQAERKSYVCPESECPRCAAGEKSSFRFRLNFLVAEGNSFTPKILEQGWTVYEALRELNKEYPLEKTLIKFSRKGTDMNDTQYFILPSSQGLNEEKLAAIKRIELLDLTPGGKKHADDFDKAPF